MERHTEIVRQWRLLLALEGKSRGLTLAEAQREAGDGVSDRTIRRDLDALTQAGFPIETAKRDGKTMFSLNRDVFRGVASAGFSLSELCALYLSRTLLAAVAGGPFQDSLASAFDKLYEALPPSLWKFIESLPGALGAKEHTSRPRSAAAARSMDTLMSAILSRRRVRMRYHSFSSKKLKDYVVEPYRLAYAQGGLYLQAFVAEYGEMRTFAAQRIEQATALEETFSPVADSPAGVFPHSLGAFSGTPEIVVVDFNAAEAPYIREREWHPSQQIEELSGGRLRLTLSVVIDWGLQAWLLGFGPAARVVRPAKLQQAIVDALEETRAVYRKT
ncbi:MAG: WYL domain-containing protein [Vicinamibacterales bacterium]